MKRILTFLIIALLAVLSAAGFSACGRTLTEEEKDYQEAEKIFDANYKKVTFEELEEITRKIVNPEKLKSNYISYMEFHFYDDSYKVRDLVNVSYVNENNALIYCRIISSGYKRNLEAVRYNYSSDCKLYYLNNIVYQNTIIETDGSVEEKTIENKIFQKENLDKFNNWGITMSFSGLRKTDNWQSYIAEDNDFFKIKLTRTAEFDEDRNINVKTYCVLDKNMELYAVYSEGELEKSFCLIQATVPFDKTIETNINSDEYVEGKIYYDHWSD